MTQTMVLEVSPRGYGLRQSIRSEVIKLWTLRSTRWTILVTLLGSALVTGLATNSVANPRSDFRGFDPTNQAMTGLLVASLTIGVLGVLAVTGEYATGTIRSSLSATPRRSLYVLTKIVVVGMTSLAIGEVVTFSCFGIGQAVLGFGRAPTASLGDPSVLRAVLMSGAVMALLGLLALGLGLVIRNTAGAMASYTALTFLLPFVFQRIPGNPGRFTPIPILANSIAVVVPQGHQMAPSMGFLLVLLYAGAILAVGAGLFVRRDA